MQPDCYEVEVLHYLSPHLIWIVVRDSDKKDELSFEQIGVYGVLPLDKTLGFLDDGLSLGLISQRCEDWVPAAAIMMKEFFESAHEVWFAPAHIEQKSSIFDDNIHKYGEIVIKTKRGKLKKLSKHLTNSGFAYYDTSEFHVRLSCGKLKTKLSTIATQEVVKNLENYHTNNAHMKDIWVNLIKRHTTVFRIARNFELSLGLPSLEKESLEINCMLRNKLKAFELCKNVDEESLGRACRKRKEVLQELVSD